VLVSEGLDHLDCNASRDTGQIEAAWLGSAMVIGHGVRKLRVSARPWRVPKARVPSALRSVSWWLPTGFDRVRYGGSLGPSGPRAFRTGLSGGAVGQKGSTWSSTRRR
jgi:hypothetical protein